MNYELSTKILAEIKKAQKILLNCHRSPDPDGIGSALAMKLVLENMGKAVTIICPSDELYENVDYLVGYHQIKTGVDFSKFNFSHYDLFITLDSSSWEMVVDDKEVFIPEIKTVVIDHHLTNEQYGKINLVDTQVASVGELLYLVFADWGTVLDKDIADCIMAGIVGDTGAFRYPGSNARTFRIAGELMKLGADKDWAVHQLYRSEPFELVKFYGEVLARMKKDASGKFIWSAVPYEVYERLGKPAMAKESSASMFAQIVDGTDFGFIAVEQKKNELAVSFRSRTGFDTAKIAVELGGGGHIYASGAKVEGLPFVEAVEKVLAVARKYARKTEFHFDKR